MQTLQIGCRETILAKDVVWIYPWEFCLTSTDGASREKPGSWQPGWLAAIPASATARPAEASSLVSSAWISNFQVEEARSHPFLYKNSKTETDFRGTPAFFAKWGGSPPTALAGKQPCRPTAILPRHCPCQEGTLGKPPERGAPHHHSSGEAGKTLSFPGDGPLWYAILEPNPVRAIVTSSAFLHQMPKWASATVQLLFSRPPRRLELKPAWPINCSSPLQALTPHLY